MRYTLVAAARSDPGKVRDTNEDSYFVGTRTIVVADGVGGAVAGELASQTLVATFAKVDESDWSRDVYAVLADAVDRSSDAIHRQVEADPSLRGMSTTATVMTCSEHRIVFAQVGDSRAYYRDRHRPGRLTQVTRDDSFVQFLVDSGLIDRGEARGHPRRNVILKAVNGEKVAPSFATYAPIGGDRYLLCSDGLSDYVLESHIGEALAEPDRDRAADRLIALALDAGAPDNVTAVVVDVVPAGHVPDLGG